MHFKIKFSLSVLIIVSYFSYAQIHQDNNNVITDSIYSTILKENRDIYIKLPESYSTNSNKKYPVIYILDGELLLSTLNLVHSYYSGGFMPEMVLVGISNTNNRSRDLTTSFVSSFYQKNGEAENFTSFFKKELIPYIEKTYPVTNYRSLIGHSYGGLFTVNTLLNHSDLFSNYLAIDPSLDWDNQKLLKQAKEVLAHKNYTGKSLFISLGSQLHMSNPKITIDNVMKDTTSFTIFPRSNMSFFEQTKKNAKNGLITTWKYYPDDLHGTVPLPSIKDGLLSLFNWYQWENTSAFNNPNTSVKK
ncbi:alpha/beta hydrolase [Polaribacter ponticola]|uniref:Alpha/beta hydrolase-fold protein n=1 Tax=Polaribacter ponticola TaxID=2978475 RepID=A0ABT5S8J5_9FLAO|nr:alpha/beta hydrolase-fold protein [Polaribacter sp. MSW5]MDD7914422.1 alpha/beta hydrolase-fold protein [Polaribacter sp. MSW5]